VSQLGFMFMACGVGAFVIGIFHVMTHAFFKALMFLGAGSVIHGMHHEQDMRRMGNLRKYMPYTYLTFLAGWLAICGIIPFSGFWSKDEILWNAASTRYLPVGWIVWIVGTIAATCTAFYMTRLVALTFWGKEKFLNGHDHSVEHEVHNYDHETPKHHAHIPHESPASMWVPLAVLAVLATIGGFVGISTAFTGGKHIGGRMNVVNFMDPIIWNPTTRHFGKEEILDSAGKPVEGTREARAEVVTANAEATEAASPYGDEGFNLAHAAESRLHSETATEWLFIVVSLLVAGFGIGLGFLFYVKDTRLPDIWAARLKPLYQASYNKYWVDEFFGWAVTRRVMDAARGVFAFDSKVIDGGVNGSAWLTRLSSRITGGTDQYFVDGVVNAIAAFIVRLMSPLFRAAQTGFAQNYALVMVLGLVAAVALFFGADIARAVKSVFALIL
jgi:NADH-quinone oxidoreductase subunit L